MSPNPPPPWIFHQGTQPLLISVPHAGTYVPPHLIERFTDAARQLPDTDWHQPLLYAFAQALGASMLVATHSRYVVDLNRPPNDASLYPGQNVTGLCPVDTFDHNPIYARGDVPDGAEIAARRDTFWTPYHAQLQAELARLRAVHGVAVLWDAHSIRSVVPRFFEGRLPDLNLGTADGASCDAGLAEELLAIARSAPGHTAVLNGRFKGGYITREYGKPSQGVHAVQLEMTWRSYMEEVPPFDYSPTRAANVQPHVKRMLEAALAFARQPAA